VPASPCHVPPARPGSRRRRCGTRAGCVVMRLVRRAIGGTARGPGRSRSRPRPRSRVGGRLDRARSPRRGASTGPGPTAPAPHRSSRFRRPALLRARRPAGPRVGGPPGSLARNDVAGCLAGRSADEQMAVRPCASGPSSASCRPPSGSLFVVVTAREFERERFGPSRATRLKGGSPCSSGR
jgi:hypothetical protein